MQLLLDLFSTNDVGACEIVVVGRIVIFFLVTTFLFLGLPSNALNIMDISESFSVVSHKLTCILILDVMYQRDVHVQEYLPKKAYRGCTVELMGPFVFPGFGH
ncbi:hypothetical protein HZH68_014849 [Vespula germanica]|uniref:Uncharacterized protein n=1 Tax=Vespula germanica TaxID=30212 RepID=A0A834MSV0_VESGE|nr:hypothetical protein HZH68_014849 [Vespula germanica]